jgi:hypothetical protein
MIVVVAAASPGNPQFAVINFSNTPPTVVMQPGFQNGNVVDCYGTLAAVGALSGLEVALFDISVPASPVQTGSVQTGFQIGSISIGGSYVLTGELNGSRVSLIDISNPASPEVISVSDCAPTLNIISSVALRMPIAVVSGDNNAVSLDFADPAVGSLPGSILYNASGASDYDGSTAAVASGPDIFTYAFSSSGITQLAQVTVTGGFGSVAVAEIPAGGYLVAAGGVGSFTVYAYPSDNVSGKTATTLHNGVPSNGTTVKFLNNPAIAPFLAVANVTTSGVFVSYYFIQVESGGPQGTKVSFFTPIPVIQVALATAYGPTLGITAFTPKRRFWPFPWPIPRWIENILKAVGL